MRKNIINDRLRQSLDDFIIGYNSDCIYWGEFALFINFHETPYGTCGVNFKNSSMNFYYNNKFLDSLRTQLEVNFVVIHELMHLLSDHVSRAKRAGFKHKMANIAMDMVINSDIVDFIPRTIAELPEKLFTIPKEYTGKRVFELVYYWLQENKEKYDEMKKDMEDSRNNGDGKGSDGSGGEGSDKPSNSGKGTTQEDIDKAFSKELQKIFENCEDYVFDEHMMDDVPDELKDEIRKDIINNLKQRGLQTGNIEKLLENLTKKKKDYLREIKSGIAQLNGNKKATTITKLNRRNIAGLKGKKKEGFVINAILDTSGSMEGVFENVLSYVFQDNIILNMIQCDTEVKDFKVIKNKNQLSKMSIKGLGGTTLQPAIDYIAAGKLNKVNTVILTDGITDVLNFSKICGKVLIITNETECQIVSNGKVRQIVVEKE